MTFQSIFAYEPLRNTSDMVGIRKGECLYWLAQDKCPRKHTVSDCLKILESCFGIGKIRRQ